MINTSRIVSVHQTDVLTLYATMLKIAGTSLTVASASEVGEFEVSAGGTLFADEPVVSMNFASGVSSATVYFVPAYDYDGFYSDGTALEATGDVDADGVTLYKATLASGAVTIEKAGY